MIIAVKTPLLAGSRCDAAPSQSWDVRSLIMLRMALVFLVIAMVSALFGFSSLAGAAYDGARVLFFVFLILFVISAILGYNGRRRSLV